jgi:hypothetical protein
MRGFEEGREMTERIRIFTRGTQWLDWQNVNCCLCKKSATKLDWEKDEISFECDLEQALADASLADGTVSAEQAKRLGYDHEKYVWPCTEIEWTDEHKRECFENEHQERIFA